MAKNVNTNVTAVLLVLGLLISGCSNFNLNLPFFSKHKVPENPPRAFFVQKEKMPLKSFKKVKINAPLNEVVRIVQQAISSTVDTTSFIVKTNTDTTRRPQTIKVRSQTLRYEDISEIEPLFYIGNYVIHDPSFQIRAQNAEYYVEVELTSDYGGYILNPRSYAKVNWDLFEYSADKADTLKVPAEAEKYYGIGSYAYEVEETYINQRGKEKSFTYWEEEKVDDKPKSKGILEARVRNKVIEFAALNNLNASTNTR